MSIDIKVNSVEQHTAFEKEAAERYTHSPVRHEADLVGTSVETPEKTVEQYLAEDDIKKLVYQALYVVLVQDHGVSLEDKVVLLKSINTEIAHYDLRELVEYVDRTIAALWSSKKIGQESYDILQAFKKIKDKVVVVSPVDLAGLDQDLAELEELIRGKRIDMVHNLA